MPPRSTKAPKSARFFTVPVRTWPTAISARRFSRRATRSASIRLRRERTMFRRSSSIERITQRTSRSR